MLSWKSLLVGILIGLLAGGGWGAWYASERRGRWERFEDRSEKALEKFNRELDLNPNQRTAVSAILKGQRERIQGIRGEIKPKMDEIRLKAREEIRLLLTPSQQARFDALEAEKDRERQERWERKEKP